MTKYALAAIASILLAGSAVAADLPSRKVAPAYVAPVAPVFTWTGAYAGVTVGASFMNKGGKDAGVGLGGTVGYNYQLPSNIVLGVEGDLSWLPLQRRVEAVGATGHFAKVDATWYGTARARAGYAINNVLVYATGGVAGADVTGASRAFWTAGGGVEFAVNRNWSVKGEYLYNGSQKVSTDVLNAAGAVTGTQKRAADFSVVRAGVNYRF